MWTRSSSNRPGCVSAQRPRRSGRFSSWTSCSETTRHESAHVSANHEAPPLFFPWAAWLAALISRTQGLRRSGREAKTRNGESLWEGNAPETDSCSELDVCIICRFRIIRAEGSIIHPGPGAWMITPLPSPLHEQLMLRLLQLICRPALFQPSCYFSYEWTFCRRSFKFKKYFFLYFFNWLAGWFDPEHNRRVKQKAWGSVIQKAVKEGFPFH